MTEERFRQMLADHERHIQQTVDAMLRQFASEFATCQRPIVEGMESLNTMQVETMKAFGHLSDVVAAYGDATSKAWQKLCEDNTGPHDESDPDWWKRGDE